MVLTGKSESCMVFLRFPSFGSHSSEDTLHTCQSPKCNQLLAVGTRTEMVLSFCYYCPYCLFSENQASGWNTILSQPFTFLHVFIPVLFYLPLLFCKPHLCQGADSVSDSSSQAILCLPLPDVACSCVTFVKNKLVLGVCFLTACHTKITLHSTAWSPEECFHLWLTQRATLCHYCSTFKSSWSSVYWAAGQDALPGLLTDFRSSTFQK